jgi:hypothetical protein
VLQTPLAQVPLGQTVPQVPQLLGSELRFTHPVGQDESGAEHWQAPLVQAWPTAQAIPQPPQLFGSLPIVFTHDPPQSVYPGAQLLEHVPSEHTSPAAHGLPQPPQLATSDWMSTHPLPQS